MTTLEYVKDYYLPLLGVFPDTEVHKNLCIAVEMNNKDDIVNAFDGLVEFIKLQSDPRIKSFDVINRYFNRLRCMLNDDFKLHLPYQYFS